MLKHATNVSCEPGCALQALDAVRSWNVHQHSNGSSQTCQGMSAMQCGQYSFCKDKKHTWMLGVEGISHRIRDSTVGRRPRKWGEKGVITGERKGTRGVTGLRITRGAHWIEENEAQVMTTKFRSFYGLLLHFVPFFTSWISVGLGTFLQVTSSIF